MNSIESTLVAIADYLVQERISFALAGGFVGNLYRLENRFTQDIDFAVALDPTGTAVLDSLLNRLGLTVGMARVEDLKNNPSRRKRQRSPVQVIGGRSAQNPARIGADFLLNTFPWVNEAIARAQHNQITIFGRKYPAITVEDFILSKLYAITNIRRYKDLDDLESVLTRQTDIDVVYLGGRMVLMELPIPRDIRQKVKIDSLLGKISRSIERKLSGAK